MTERLDEIKRPLDEKNFVLYFSKTTITCSFNFSTDDQNTGLITQQLFSGNP